MTFDEFYLKYKTTSKVVKEDKDIIEVFNSELIDSTISITFNQSLISSTYEVFIGVVDLEYKRVVSPLLFKTFSDYNEAKNYFNELKKYNDLIKLDEQLSS